MGDSCCLCGLVLALKDSDFPRWCQDIRALCWFEDRPILSGRGYSDDDSMPFCFPIPSYGSHRFFFRRTAEVDEDFCYPFHTACWTLLREIDHERLVDHNIGTLFDNFKSGHYNKDARALRWGQNLYFEDILGSNSGKQDLADPLLHIDFQELLSSCGKIEKTGNSPFPKTKSNGQLSRLPIEILELILCKLSFHDTEQLLEATRIYYNGDYQNLPFLFWESRFWVYGETGFARSICPSSCSWKDWFFTIESALTNSPKQMNLRSRKRIWKLGIDLIDLIRTIKEPDRVLHGDIVTPLPIQWPYYIASCLALKYDMEGCRELKQRYAFLGARASKSQLCAVTSSYILLSNQRLISGLTFAFLVS